MDLFGKSGARLLPLLGQGSEGVAKLRAEIGELGIAYDETFAQQSEEVNDNLERLKLGFKGLAVQAIGPMLPQLVELTHDGVELAKTIVGLVKHSEVLKSGLLLLTGKGVLGLVSKLGGPAGLIGLVKTLGAFALEVVAPLLVLDDVLTFLAGGKSVTGDLLDKIFGKGTAKRVLADIQEIWVAVKQGAKDAIADAKQLWEELTQAVKDHAGQIVAVLGLYAAYRTAVAIVTGAKIAYQAITTAIAIAEKAYAAAVYIAMGAMSLLNTETWAATAASAAFNASMGTVLVTLGAVAAAAAAAYAAYSQLDKLKNETGGLGFTGIVDQMVKQGTINPFEAVDTYQNEQARAEAAGAGTATVPLPAPAGGTTKITQTVAPNIVVTVPPGTPADQARFLADAARQGTQVGSDDLRSVLAATTQVASPP
jgi:hypothetical protein